MNYISFLASKRSIFIFLVALLFVFSAETVKCIDLENDLSNLIEEYHTTLDELFLVIEGGAPEEMQNPQYLNRVYNPGTKLIKLKLYDMLGSISESETNRIEGTLMMSNYTGFKEVNGSKINFGYDYIYDKSRIPLYQEGDLICERGTLNTEKNELTYRFYKQRDDKIFEENIIELFKLDSGNFLLQYILWQEGKANSYVFIRFNKNKVSFVIAQGEISRCLKYSSIKGSDITAVEMAEEYKMLLAGSIDGGQFEYQEVF